MNNINIQDFESSIEHLVNAPVKDNSKGKPMEEWIKTNFKLESKSSRITNDGALKNRVSDPFRHEKSIVVFVCKDDLWEKKKDIILEHIETFKYPKLQTVLVMSESKPFKYEKLMVFRKNEFSEWLIEKNHIEAEIQDLDIKTENKQRLQLNIEEMEETEINRLTAMRTKPFLLLAGISGTGKSRIVKEMAFDSCPDLGDLRKDKTTPGNYCLVEVKPNWHDSTELLGYESAIKNTYVLTPFVKFLAKAMKYENGENKVPFFVCLDEMNLAPVEQYFAEFLSVLESRKLVDGKITSEPLVDASHFKAHPEMMQELFDIKKEKSTSIDTTEDCSTHYGIENELFDRLKNEGLRIPSNVVVIGTVNMDETTHQFSRKVIDRAMTIEMNIADGDEPFKSFFESNNDLDYREEAVDANVYLPQFASASNALQALEVNNHEDVVALKAGLPALLGELNQALNNTPFKIAYRVENELVLYFTALRQANETEKADNLIAQAMDDIMMMKVLPRIEGDDELLTAPLQALNEFASKHSFANSLKKIEEMDKRLKQAHFTSFWP